MQKVLIVTYYWPPSGGSGVQRWLKFIKYLRKFGIEPVVYTPKNPDISLFDTSLHKDIPDNLTVLQRRIFEPYALFRLFARRKTNFGVGFTSIEGHTPNRFTRLSIWIRGNCFIPDPRVLWIKPSIRFLKKYICKNGIEAIVTTGPPHSMHLIGMALKKKLNIAWVADFRDPWTNIDFIDNLKLNSRSLAKHLHLEKQVVESADCVVVVSPQMKKDFEGYNPKQVEVITNGFDADDFPKNVQKRDEQFTITHVGT
nr:glycosyltransferase [Tenuifilaceae bacterium]